MAPRAIPPANTSGPRYHGPPWPASRAAGVVATAIGASPAKMSADLGAGAAADGAGGAPVTNGALGTTSTGASSSKIEAIAQLGGTVGAVADTGAAGAGMPRVRRVPEISVYRRPAGIRPRIARISSGLALPQAC